MDEQDAGTEAQSPTKQEVAAGSGEVLLGERRWSAGAKEEASIETLELMEQVVGQENLRRALRRVERNGGAAGVDGMHADQLRAYLREHWPSLRWELMEGRYKPKPVRGVDIPKPGGGKRRLGIPTVLDRFVQQAVLQVLTPIFDPGFSESSYGYRPSRSAQQAVAAGRRHVKDGRRWVVDLDLEKFFDRVNHDVLMARVGRRVKDKRVLRLIRRFLEAGMMADGIVEARVEGTPQGGPLSPLLSNILLDELDKELEKRGHRFCRYADDCNVYAQSKRAGDRVMASLERFLRTRLRLVLNRAKSVVDRPWKRTFLGYSMTSGREPRLRVPKESAQRARETLRAVFRRGRGRRLTRVIEEVNEVTRGWVGYYRLAEVKGVFEDLDTWIRRRCRWILWRQWKRPKTRSSKLRSLGLEEIRARQSAYNGRGPWWNAGASHMNASVSVAWLETQGLLGLLAQHQRLSCPA